MHVISLQSGATIRNISRESDKVGAIILAGGRARRLPRKCFRLVGGKPLVLHVFEQIAKITKQIIIVARTIEQMKELSAFLPCATVIIDRMDVRAPLVGLLTGLRYLKTEYVIATSCDVPFIEPKLFHRLFAYARGNDCALPVSNGRIDPLIAVYKRKSALLAARTAVKKGELSMHDMIALLRKPVYVARTDLCGTQADLLSFENINTPLELEKARRILRSRRRRDGTSGS